MKRKDIPLYPDSIGLSTPRELFKRADAKINVLLLTLMRRARVGYRGRDSPPVVCVSGPDFAPAVGRGGLRFHPVVGQRDDDGVVRVNMAAGAGATFLIVHGAFAKAGWSQREQEWNKRSAGARMEQEIGDKQSAALKGGLGLGLRVRYGCARDDTGSGEEGDDSGELHLSRRKRSSVYKAQ